MANEHTLKRILDQIAQHKVTLSRVDPEDEEAEIREAEQIKREPFRKVKSVFSEENLQKRMEENAPPIEESESSTWAESPNPPVEAQVGHPDHTPLEDLPPEVKENLEEEKESYEFRSVFDLKDFILTFHDQFDDFQKNAINSIVSVCDTIGRGCKCKKGSRLKIAEDYYVEFITQNKDSGIIEKFKEVLKTKNIKFYSKDRLFLEK
jgi:hypothetical protein